MHLILFSRRRTRVRQLNLARHSTRLGLLVTAAGALAAIFAGGYAAGNASATADAGAAVSRWQADLDGQSQRIRDVRRDTDERLNALALQLGEMNAEVIRLDALGQRLTDMAGLTDGEFDFSSPPGMGGPEEPLESAGQQTYPDLLADIDELSVQLDSRRRQLDVLQGLLLDRDLARRVQPRGRPVQSGWISSRFGRRTDPFTGKRAFHKGVDFAAASGTDVVAVGAGVVTYSGDRYGYGQMIEINHGNGYSTRYAHNSENLVTVGEQVQKGEVIAKMGSTGRATGPNLHFEVLRNGKVVDPIGFIRKGG